MSDFYNIRLSALTDAGTAVNIDTDRVKPGESLEVVNSAFTNSSGESLNGTFYVSDGTADFAVAPQLTAANNNSASTNANYVVTEGQFLRCTVKGTSDEGIVLVQWSVIRHFDRERVTVFQEVATAAAIPKG